MSDAVVTVVVPGRDVAEYAAEALESLRAQTFDAWRAVLVDDASRDDTGALFRAAATADDRFTVVSHAEHRGLSAARNTGLDLVRTPLVGFLDADDRFTPWALERLVGAVTASGSELVVGAYVRLRPDGSGGYAAGAVQPWVTAATSPPRQGTSLAEHPEASGNVVAWSKVSRIDLWRRVGLRFPEGRLFEDQVVAQQLYTAARGFDVIPDVVVEWRERAEGTSITQRTATLEVLADYLAALAEGIAVLQAAGEPAAARARARLILHLDLPPLQRIAADHPDDEYRRRVEQFTRTVKALAG